MRFAAVGDGYRMNPVEDVQLILIAGRVTAKREHDQEEDSTMLMDATMKGDMPPLALPKQEYMERAKKIWQDLDLGPLRPQSPWFGYSLGDWLPQWTRRPSAPRKQVSRQWQDQREASAQGPQAGNKIPARR